jgi:hypothetical protein
MIIVSEAGGASGSKCMDGLTRSTASPFSMCLAVHATRCILNAADPRSGQNTIERHASVL